MLLEPTTLLYRIDSDFAPVHANDPFSILPLDIINIILNCFNQHDRENILQVSQNWKRLLLRKMGMEELKVGLIAIRILLDSAPLFPSEDFTPLKKLLNPYKTYQFKWIPAKGETTTFIQNQIFTVIHRTTIFNYCLNLEYLPHKVTKFFRTVHHQCCGHQGRFRDLVTRKKFKLARLLITQTPVLRDKELIEVLLERRDTFINDKINHFLSYGNFELAKQLTYQIQSLTTKGGIVAKIVIFHLNQELPVEKKWIHTLKFNVSIYTRIITQYTNFLIEMNKTDQAEKILPVTYFKGNHCLTIARDYYQSGQLTKAARIIALAKSIYRDNVLLQNIRKIQIHVIEAYILLEEFGTAEEELNLLGSDYWEPWLHNLFQGYLFKKQFTFAFLFFSNMSDGPLKLASEVHLRKLFPLHF